MVLEGRPRGDRRRPMRAANRGRKSDKPGRSPLDVSMRKRADLPQRPSATMTPNQGALGPAAPGHENPQQPTSPGAGAHASSLRTRKRSSYIQRYPPAGGDGSGRRVRGAVYGDARPDAERRYTHWHADSRTHAHTYGNTDFFPGPYGNLRAHADEYANARTNGNLRGNADPRTRPDGDPHRDADPNGNPHAHEYANAHRHTVANAHCHAVADVHCHTVTDAKVRPAAYSAEHWP